MQNNGTTKKALIHKVNGDFIGAFVYKDNNPDGAVQPITLRKDNIDKFYHKLLDVLPPTYKGKNPIGSILPDYAETQDVYPINQAMESVIIKARFLQEEDDENFLEPGQKLSARVIPSDVKIPDHISEDDLYKLNDALKSTKDMDDLAKLFPNHTASLQNKFNTDRQGLRKLLKVTEIAKNSWGPQWAKQLHSALNKNANAPVETKSQKKPRKPRVAASDAASTPATTVVSPQGNTPKKLTKIPYLGTTGTHELDTRYLSKALPLTINKSLDQLQDDNPELVKDLYDNLGENWKDILSLARVASDINSDLLQLPNFNEIADGIFNAAKNSQEVVTTPILPPSDPEKTAHYHNDGKKYPFSPIDVKNALINLDNMNPLAVVTRDPKLHKILQTKFGPNWGVLLSVAQRLTRYKALNHPDPIAKVKSEYKAPLERSFGADWESNFNKVINSLDNKAVITQADPNIAEKEKAQNVQIAYQNADQVASPDLGYLKNIALPSLIDKTNGYIATLDEEDPNLAKELETKLGPSWQALVLLSKIASKSVSNQEDPYAKLMKLIQDNPVFGTNLEKKLGPGFADIVNSVVQSTTGIKPPRALDTQQATNAVAGAQAGQPQPAAQDAQNTQQTADPSTSGSAAPAPAQADPGAQAVAQDPAQSQDPTQSQDPVQNQQAQEPQELTEPIGATEDPTIPDNVNPDATIGNTGIVGDGSVPQSKNNNKELDKEPQQAKPLTVSLPKPEPTPTGDLKYIDNHGNFRKLAVDSIIKALDIDEINDPKKARDAFDLLGSDYKQLFAYIHMGQHFIDRGKDPAEIWKKQNEISSTVAARAKKLGPDFETILDHIAEILQKVNMAKQQQIAAQQPEIPPVGENPVAATQQQPQEPLQ